MEKKGVGLVVATVGVVAGVVLVGCKALQTITKLKNGKDGMAEVKRIDD